MNKREKNKRNRGFAAFVTLFMALIMPLGLLMLPASAAESIKYDASQLDVELVLGYDGSTGSVFTDMTFPVSVVLDNKTAEDLSGYIEFNTSYSYKSGTVRSYKFPFSVAAHTKKKTEIRINGFDGDTYVLNVRSENGKLLRQLNGSLVRLSSSPLLMGWMSDNASSVKVINRLNGFQIDYSAVAAVPLTPDNFPADISEISQFAIIFLNDVDLSASSAFTAKQTGLLKKYIANGGTVIIGTGSSGIGTLKAFREFFAGDVDAAVTTKTGQSFTDSYLNTDFGFYDMIYFALNSNFGDPDSELDKSDPDFDPDFDEHEPDLNYSQKYVNTIKFSGATVCTVNDANFEAAQKEPLSPIEMFRHKSSNLYVANINLASPELMSSSDSGAVLLQAVIRAGAYDCLSGQNFTSNTDIVRYLTAYLEKSPSIGLMILFLLVYVAAGITTPFIVARNKKKPLIAWIGIPAVAAVCTAVIFFYGFMVKGGGSVDNTFTIAEISPSGDVTAKSVSMVKTPSSGTRRLSFDAEDVLYSTKQLTLYHSGDFSSPMISSAKKDAGLNYSGISAWDYTIAEGSWDVSGTYGGFTASAKLLDDGKTIEISVTNNTGKELSSVAIYSFGSTFCFDKFKVGETVTAKCVPSYDGFNVTEAIYTTCYKPLGINRKVAENDMAEFMYNNGYYSYPIWRNTSDLFSLLDDPALKNRARLMAYYGGACLGTTPDIYDSIVVSGFDDSAADPLRINGKKAHKSHGETLVTETIHIGNLTGDISYSISGEAILNLGTSYGVGMIDKDGSFAPDGNSDCLAVCSLPIPTKNVASTISRLTVKIASESSELPQVFLVVPPVDEYGKDATLTELKYNASSGLFETGLRLSQCATDNDAYGNNKYNNHYKEYLVKMNGNYLWISSYPNGLDGPLTSPYFISIIVQYSEKQIQKDKIKVDGIAFEITEGD